MVSFGKNQMETSKVTSKTSSLKALLLKAWCERWTDLHWGTHIKSILPRGVSGDVYNLADIILQQALIGLGPNQLVLSYLKHSLSSQLISYAAVVQRISKYDGFNKPYCILSLLEFLENIQSGITCKSKPEESILPGATLSLVHWLLQCMQHTYENPGDLKQELIKSCLHLLQTMLQCKFTTAMLYLAKHENKDLYLDIVKKSRDILDEPCSEAEVSDPLHSCLQELCHLDAAFRSESASIPECVTFSMQPLIAVQVLMHPNCDTETLANQLLLLRRLKNYSHARLYFELLRSSLMSLNDVLDTGEESQWGAFTFIKLPQILQHLYVENSDDIVECFEMLLEMFPLLDILDARCACNTVESLLTELEKVHILSEQQSKQIIEKRKEATVTLHSPETSPPSISKVIICAEPTLARVLRTLDTEFSKIQDALLNVLSQVLNGKSFDLILAVAAVKGNLCTFVTKLIKFNECSKQSNPGDSSKTAQTKVMLFDITFLMLCSIVQRYGSKVVFAESGGSDSFFERWVRECMVEAGRPKPHRKMLEERNSVGVDDLLRAFNASDPELKKCPDLNCYEICLNIPAVIYDVLGAWETSVLSSTDVKRILDAMRSKMCCLPVCAASWLCSYMQVIHQEALLKPMNMVQQFLTAITLDETPQQDFFKERSMLMVQIIRKMQCDVFPPISPKTKVVTLSHCIVSKSNISEQLDSVWESCIIKGWLTIEAAHTFQSMINTCGAEWVVLNLIKELMKLLFEHELNVAVNVLFSVFHLDIEKCTLKLLELLPQYLHNQFLAGELMEPQASALARLTTYCIYAAAQSQAANPTPTGRNKKKESEDYDEPAAKILRLSGATLTTDGGDTLEATTLQDPLLSAIKSLFSYLLIISERPGAICEQTHFVLRLLEYLVQCGHDMAPRVLSHMPATLLPNLIRLLPDSVGPSLILRLYDLNTLGGRRDTARDLCLLRNMQIKTQSYNLS